MSMQQQQREAGGATAALNAPQEEEPKSQYLTFILGEEVFAMDIGSIREIIQHVAMTPVPLMPAFVRGVINLRGAVVPVIDLNARFGGARALVGKKTCVIIFDASREGERMELGLLVDAVSEVVAMGASQIEEAPQFGGPIRREFIRGMGRIDGRFIALLEPERALDIEDMTQIISRH